ncbi:rhomboid family intramembrane serine protease [Alkalihalobacillus sp. AL-G]|uniref:rhomboid family intramembrane serine protease n=1 Tax=Alkalihalobacillus sp. AL-G TaxID=2926399 RepID=UPI00272ABD1F|nr:rhomboid family intramembrane serine protease [Alkalihalobacillus sp. AL-G]WLD93660.1 rhomboid family intramembrane serine protease [Alkalihalobacillus sp. AL-G]
MFVRTENFRTFIRLYPIVSTIIVVHILLFIAVNVSSLVLIYTMGHNYSIAVGEYWRLVTPIFIHQSFPHVLFNTFSLYLFGPALERIIGKFKFIIGYIGAGVIANIATFLLEGPGYSHIGASGAIFGLFGFFVYIIYARKELIDHRNSQLILSILVLSVVMTFVMPNINILGHLFGLVGGAALAPILLAGKTRRV